MPNAQSTSTQSDFSRNRIKAWCIEVLRSRTVSRGYSRALGFFNRSESENANRDQRSVEVAPGRLRSYFDSHLEGNGIYKWNHYFEIYERHLAKFVNRDVRLCEIGVYSGGSLEMWRDYLGQRCRLYGIDIEPACKSYENEYIKICIGDQSDRSFWKTFREETPTLDVLIDDGGHTVAQQIVTLEETLPYLNPGGVYICEDVHGVWNGFAHYVARSCPQLK